LARPLLASLLLLLAADEAEEASYQALVALFQREVAEPEPPPGLRAPTDSERYRRAAEQYEADLARWREQEARRRAELIGLADRHLERFAQGEHRAGVLYLRGATLFRALARGPAGPGGVPGRGRRRRSRGHRPPGARGMLPR
jgi:hypothetical protein